MKSLDNLKTHIIIQALNESFDNYVAKTQKKFEHMSKFTEYDFKNAGGAEKVIAQFITDAKIFTAKIYELAAPYVLELVCQRCQREDAASTKQ